LNSLPNESELIAKVLISNDQRAFSLLVKHFQQPIRQYCRRLCAPDISLADDIAQETFWQAYRKLKLFSGKGKFQGWLFRIAYFQFLQYLRKTKKQQSLTSDDGTIEDIEVLGHAQQVSDQRDIEAAMTHLKATERICLTLQFSFGYSQTEICEILQLPLGTVKSQCKRGKDKLSYIFKQAERKTEINNSLNGVA
jgi:RNA polymerase sigma-70 factor, ECF subfamily